MKRLLALLGITLALGVVLLAQTAPTDNPNCAPEVLSSQLDALAGFLPMDFENNPQKAVANAFKLGTFYQQIALNCGYAPNEDDVNALVSLVLSVADVETIILASSVGGDVDSILAELETLNGDPINGQQLYNGLAFGLDGGALGCAGCHNGQSAPTVQGTWTRANDERIKDPALAGYSVTRYLVESIVHPNAYIAPDYLANLMPDNYGKRLNAQQLADLVAYLESQDQ
jgi:mono/diheme cytochrome c family protein